jgi:hypothetical protein
MNAGDMERLVAMAGVPELGERTEQVVRLQAEMTTMLGHYSRALDEIYKLRRALAYEARVTTGLLNYASLPKGASERIETMGNRLRAAARGEVDLAYGMRSGEGQRLLMDAGALPTLTRQRWEKQAPSDTETSPSGGDHA